jgi:hypothetical protein
MDPCAGRYEDAQEVDGLKVYCGEHINFAGPVPYCCYELKVKIPSGGLKCDPCGSLYLVGVTLTAFDACGKPGHIGAYCKGASVMLYDPEAAPTPTPTP